MTPDLQAKLENCHGLPTPSGVATQIVEFANHPDPDFNELSKILERDPAVAIKILRLANSPVYAQRRRIENLKQAVLVLGLDAAISMALSFSLLKSLPRRNEEAEGLDYPLFWRRSLLAASIGRIMATKVGIPYAEELFLTCLIQDVGMVALDRTFPGVYDGLGGHQVRQHILIDREREKLKTDHAAVGAWLLKKWGLPDLITKGVAGSHDIGGANSYQDDGFFARSVALSSLIAESYLAEDGDRRIVELADTSEQYLDLDPEVLGELLEDVGEVTGEVERIFETEILVAGRAEDILEEARAALTLRTVKTLTSIEHLQTETQGLRVHTQRLEESGRRDGLTKLYNRAYLDEYLNTTFANLEGSRKPLSIAFVDLDKFKQVNDTYGHQVGDQVLAATAQILQSAVRTSDVVARYGGEEFVMVFPGANTEQVKAICGRIAETFRNTQHEIPSTEGLTVTVSIGIATRNDINKFDSVETFVGAADQALYQAKLEGGDRSLFLNNVA